MNSILEGDIEMKKYYAIYSKDRSAVVCRCKNASHKNVSSTRSYRRDINNIGENLEIRVLTSIKRQQIYLDVVQSVSPTTVFEIIETDSCGKIL